MLNKLQDQDRIYAQKVAWQFTWTIHTTSNSLTQAYGNPKLPTKQAFFSKIYLLPSRQVSWSHYLDFYQSCTLLCAFPISGWLVRPMSLQDMIGGQCRWDEWLTRWTMQWVKFTRHGWKVYVGNFWQILAWATTIHKIFGWIVIKETDVGNCLEISN